MLSTRLRWVGWGGIIPRSAHHSGVAVPEVVFIVADVDQRRRRTVASPGVLMQVAVAAVVEGEEGRGRGTLDEMGPWCVAGM